MSLTPSQLAAQPQQPQAHASAEARARTPMAHGGTRRVKRCPSCGLASSVDTFFCSHCGADISLERSELLQAVVDDVEAHAPESRAAGGTGNVSDKQTPAQVAAAVGDAVAEPRPRPATGAVAAGAAPPVPVEVPVPVPAPAAPRASSERDVDLNKLRAAAVAAIPAPALPPAHRPCPQCSQDNPAYAFLCISCGADLSTPPQPGARVSASPAAGAAQAGPVTAPPLIDRTKRVPPPIPGTLAKSGIVVPAGPPPRLQLLIGNKSFDCHDGDILGRAGTLASDMFAPFGTVSRHHASIILQGNRWFVVPSPSVHNATRLDGQELKRGEPTPLTGEHTLGMSTKCEVKLRVVPG